jgi:probable HAF family extracellular repeat protein
MRITTHRRGIIAGLLGALALYSSSSAAQTAYSVQVIRPFFIPEALNKHGQAAGLTLNDEGYGQGSIWTRSDGRIVPLGKIYDAVSDINDAGLVAGSRYLAQGQYQATIFANGGFRDLGSLGGNTSIARAINASGQVTGFAATAGGQYRAFVYTNGTMMDIGTLGGWQSAGNDINDHGQVAGAATLAPGDSAPQHAFLYDGGKMIDLGTFGGVASAAESINNAGQIVGNVTAADGNLHGFYYEDGVSREIFGPSGAYVIPQWINEHGDVVGNAGSAGSTPFAFIYSKEKFSILNTLLDSREGWEVYQAQAIDEGGNIAGWGCRPHPGGSGLDCAGLFLSPVPEPAAWSLWATGVLCGWATCKRTQRKRNSARRSNV